MKIISTTIAKSARNGWQAKTNIELTAPYRLSIETSKRCGGGVSTNAMVCKVDGGFLTYELCGDFSECVELDRDARSTEKTVAAQHQVALAQLPAILERVYAFPKYAGKIERLEALPS